MGVNSGNKSKILVIHGVQTGDNQDLRQHEVIRKNLEKQLGGLDIPFETDIFKYEDINDETTYLIKKILAAMTGNKITGWLVEEAVDLAGDVGIALLKGEVYRLIVDRFKAKIMESYEKEEPVYIVAHSLGTIYAFDAVNELIKEEGLFLYNRMETRAVQGLVTLGSPIALDLFDRDWKKMTSLVPAGQTVDINTKLFPWINYWDPTDPVVSGSLVGLPWDEGKFRARFGDDETYLKGWDVMSRSVITNSGHLGAHTAYWNDVDVMMSIRQMVARYGNALLARGGEYVS